MAKDRNYLTLEILKQFQHGDCVTIFHIKTDVTSMVIPMDIIQDGPSENIENFPHKIFFRLAKNVSINYYLNATGEEKAIRLDHLKQVI